MGIEPLQVALPTFSKEIKKFSTESPSTCNIQHKPAEGYNLSLQDYRKGNYRIGLEFGTPNFEDMRVKFEAEFPADGKGIPFEMQIERKEDIRGIPFFVFGNILEKTE